MSSATPQETSISLYYKDGSSDKEYHCQLVRAIAETAVSATGQDWVVNFQYGRRGQSLQSGTKTSSPVAYDKARKIFDKLVAEKKGKGYTEGELGTPYAGSEKAGEVSGLVPQLLNDITEERALELLEDDDWMMEEKKDGVRCMIRSQGSEVIASNRKGLVVSIPEPIVEAIQGWKNDCVVDGERIGDVFHVFDLLEGESMENSRMTDFCGHGVGSRYTELEFFLKHKEANPAIQLVRAAWTTAAKRKLFEELRAANAEGVVFKKKDSKYVPGRPNSGGNQLKFKFKASATVRVSKVNDKRSVQVQGRSDAYSDAYSDLGNVTIPVNQEIPKAGNLVEVEYLYAYPNGCLFQPVYKGKRTDKSDADLVETLKFKQGAVEDDDA